MRTYYVICSNFEKYKCVQYKFKYGFKYPRDINDMYETYYLDHTKYRSIKARKDVQRYCTRDCTENQGFRKS